MKNFRDLREKYKSPLKVVALKYPAGKEKEFRDVARKAGATVGVNTITKKGKELELHVDDRVIKKLSKMGHNVVDRTKDYKVPKREEVEEKKLTPAELKKREEIAKAIEKDDPDMPMDKKMAIATAQAKKVAEAKLDYSQILLYQKLREGRKRFTDKEIKQAYGILNDPRYRQGNYSGAVRAIEKLKRGLSKHPSVANALKRANEDINEYGGPKMSKKAYHEYGKNYHKEETLHEITLPRKEFDKIKKGDVITLHFDSSMKKGHKEKVKVKSKTRSNKHNVDIINMGSDTDSRNRTKFKFFSRGGKDATLAWGDMGVTLTKYVVEALEECASKDDFKPHMMYDPKTGKAVKANTYADHVKYDKMGYTHEKPEIKEDYRKLAQKGMGTESERDARVGLEMDFYDSKGNKQFGKITRKTRSGYTVKDEKGKMHSFAFLDRQKAKSLLKQDMS